MRRALRVGDEAPNFDLASTEDVVLMLRDEVPRTPVLLYFFSDAESERTRADLTGLQEAADDLAKVSLKVLGVSSAGLDALKALQRDLGLGFPLLRDDRNLSSGYGLDSQDDAGAAAVFVLVGRDQKVLWIANPAPSASDGVHSAIAALPHVSSTVNYPRKVINRLVDLWVD